MSPILPPELFDHIVDQLSTDPITLKNCSLVSKSWVPRTRGYLFAEVNFDSDGSMTSLDSWMAVFPDPSNSPAYRTQTLLISDLAAFRAATVRGNPWVRSFTSLVKLVVDVHWWDDHELSFVQLHGLSPTLKSLRIDRSHIPISKTFDFVCSFPLLEDLSLRASCVGSYVNDTKVHGPVSPKLTGSLLIDGDTMSIARRLLELPSGIHFSKITIPFVNLTMSVVSRCSDTLQTLCIDYNRPSSAPPISLSDLRKLRDVEFRLGRAEVQYITMTLETAKSDKLRRITITISSRHVLTNIGEVARQNWRELDQLLVQLWTSCSIFLRIRYKKGDRGYNPGDHLPSLLPELMRMGIAELILVR